MCVSFLKVEAKEGECRQLDILSYCQTEKKNKKSYIITRWFFEFDTILQYVKLTDDMKNIKEATWMDI